MSDLLDGLRWLLSAENWSGPRGIGVRLAEHLRYSAIATLVAVVVGLPLGLAIGHTGRGRFVAANVAGLLRAVPTFGVVSLLFVWRPLTVWPVLVALVLLAVPPVMLNAAAGIQSVDPGVRDAARGMGLTSRQVLWQVEVPNAVPLILAGVRSAANQVLATATVAGFVGIGGLGAFIFSGSGTQRYEIVYGSTIAVVVVVLVVEGLFALLQRLAVSPGLRRPRRHGHA